MSITSEDIRIVSQNIIEVKMEFKVYDSTNTLIDELDGICEGGSLNINSDSSIRRTASFVLTPTRQITNLSEKSLIWLNKNVKIRLGIKNQRTDSYVWYNMGSYLYQDANTQYDESTNQMTVSLGDWMLKLDGTINGQVGGAITTIIPAYQENEYGEPISYNTIKEAMEQVLSQIGGLNSNEYNVSDIGEYKAFSQYNENWESYRSEYPLWNMIPYDLEFSTGCTVYEIVEKLGTLYPNYDFAFDENGVLQVHMIPSGYDDDIDLSYNDLYKLIISESVQTDLTTVKNICEVWGETIDAEYFVDDIGLNNLDIYEVTIDGYSNYSVGDRFAFCFTEECISGQLLKINDLESLVIYNELDDQPMSPGELDTHHIHVFKITRAVDDGGDFVNKLMYLGVDQAHGINVLTDGTTTPGYTDGTFSADYYSIEYYRHIFNCDNISLTIIEDSPFTVQKLGNRIDVKKDGDYENITSDSLALSRAEYENWKNCRLTDAVTITTKLLPFVKPYQKFSYKKHGYIEIEQFISKDVSHDFDNGTTTITMYKFYPLYPQTIENGGLPYMTYRWMSGYTYNDLRGVNP